jgi:hypothetical protein
MMAIEKVWLPSENLRFPALTPGDKSPGYQYEARIAG